ncbi:MAG: NAD(P)/FAD-dependent oxidoreductase, partial [Microlunatus sp.]|nr:NAD(P)/FAD-dependent oxidoreductase [Microlunatus sp.]
TLTGRGVYYGVNASDASQCAGDDVFLVGAGNSAGQAILNLAKHASQAVLVVRGVSLESSMSQYLVDRITSTPNIEVRLRHEISAVHGSDHLEAVELTNRDSGATETVATSWLFVFIGAEPHTDWLGDAVRRDPHGFIVTGHDLLATTEPAEYARWSQARPPLPLETAVPGVFAAGDVRLDSMKRVASAVGEGAMAVANIHQYLAMA